MMMKNMNLIKILIISGILAIILISGCVEEKNEEVRLCEKIQDMSGDNKNVCKILGDAIAKQEVLICKKIDNDDLWQSVCIREVAVAKQDILLCKDISSISEQYVCTLMVANLKQNVSLCEEIDRFWRDGCIRVVAVAKQDATLCEKILDINEKKICISDVATTTNKS